MAFAPADLLQALPHPVVLVDQRAFVQAFSPQAAQLFPLLKTGDPLAFVLRNPAVVDALAKCLAEGDAQTVEINAVMPEQRRLFIRIEAVGDKMGALLSIEDRGDADALDRMRSDFVANASHELRTPLASLLGFIETLQGPARDDEKARHKFLGIMAQQARRMSRLIDDLLSLSRVEMRQHQRPSGMVALQSVIAESLDGLSQQAKEAGVDIKFDAPEQSFSVRADRDDLVRVIDNLVGNAIRYGAAGGLVEVSLTAQNQKAGIAVRDFGPGIPADHVPRLTERFYRVDTQQSRENGGTGLGLAIVKHILMRHRGRLDIDSTVGQGSVFTAWLPLGS